MPLATVATPTPLILASRSQQRLTLLRQIGVTPALTVAADIDETPRRNESARTLAGRLAAEKAAAGYRPGAAVLGADTVVAVGRRIVPKATDADTARQCLSLLSGRRHRVYGGVCVIDAEGRSRTRIACSIVAFKRLEDADIESALAAGDWRDKAGGYAIQGWAATLIRFLSGSYSTVVGLPLFETAQLLRSAAVALTVPRVPVVPELARRES